MKKIVKKTPMKKGGTVKKAFFGSLLGGLATNAISGMFGDKGGNQLATSQNARANGPNLTGSMKKGGKVVVKRKAKTGTSLGMKSVKAGVDKNPGVTRADIIAAATKKAKTGTSVPKNNSVSKNIGNLNKAKSGASMKKCKYGCK